MRHQHRHQVSVDGTERRPRRSVPSLRFHAALAVAALLVGVALLTGALDLGGEGGGVARVERELPITAMDQGLGVANNSPLLQADPTDPRFVVLANRLDAPDFSCALEVSGDGGRSWAGAQPVADLPPGADKCYAPEVAFDANGILYYLFVGLAGAGNEPIGAFLTTSADRGATFSPPRPVLGPLNFGVRMAIDRGIGEAGRIHLVWLHATSDPPLGGFGPPPNPILSAYSDDGGMSFSEPVQVSDPNRSRVVAPALTLSSENHVHVAYYDLGADRVDYQGLEGPVFEGTWSLVLATSTDGGQSFSPGTLVDGDIVPFERVMLIFTMPPPALVSDGERLCAAWADARNGDPDAVARCSQDGGASWAGVRRLNDDPVGNGVWQYLPRLGLAPGDRLDAIFYDRRATPQNLATGVHYTYSMDGGKSFAPNLALASEATDPRIGQQYTNAAAAGQVEFGSRLGLLSGNDHVVAAWTDTRNSKAFTTGQDIFAAVVRVPSAAQPAWTRWLGIAAAGAGALAALALVPRYRNERRRRPRVAGSIEGAAA